MTRLAIHSFRRLNDKTPVVVMLVPGLLGAGRPCELAAVGRAGAHVFCGCLELSCSRERVPVDTSSIPQALLQPVGGWDSPGVRGDWAAAVRPRVARSGTFGFCFPQTLPFLNLVSPTSRLSK